MKSWEKLHMVTMAFILAIIIAPYSMADEGTKVKEMAVQDVTIEDEEDDLDEHDEVGTMETDISKLPEIVSAAAQGAKENFAITGFRKEKEIGQVVYDVYDVYGLSGELCYEIEVTENGQVLEIENCD